ncbi:hypothetical protein SAMN05443662_1564 [Sulfurivirga caldicuralii]|uniref:Capsule assembly protein Wzi n=1 Tax=Sulfurivirga caldicuralii TaxID=364032 RepID=A0A1N6H593_9GAMM|nr:hypothetical protein [Sulfurivirga caldicuralii]SIO14926.1 hypothetical protein SAMN05443662_1564 [Sulfurivirga caldicuralii]
MARPLARITAAFLAGLLLGAAARADCLDRIDRIEAHLFTHPNDRNAKALLEKLLQSPRCRPDARPATPPALLRKTAALALQWLSNPYYLPQGGRIWLTTTQQRIRLQLPTPPPAQPALRLDFAFEDVTHQRFGVLMLRQINGYSPDFRLRLGGRLAGGMWRLQAMRLYDVRSLHIGWGHPLSGTHRLTAWFGAESNADNHAFDNLQAALVYDDRHGAVHDFASIGFTHGINTDYPGRGTFSLGGGVEMSRPLALGPTLQLRTELQGERDLQDWSALLQGYGARESLILALEARLVMPRSPSGQWYLSARWARQMSNIPLFDWQAVEISLGARSR